MCAGTKKPRFVHEGGKQKDFAKSVQQDASYRAAPVKTANMLYLQLVQEDLRKDVARLSSHFVINTKEYITLVQSDAMFLNVKEKIFLIITNSIQYYLGVGKKKKTNKSIEIQNIFEHIKLFVITKKTVYNGEEL